jgi:hypothetical protein
MRINILSIFSLLVASMFFTFEVHATHARAGEIIYKQVGTYTFEITVVYYTETTSLANRDEIELFFGDDTKETVPLNRTKLRFLPNSTRYNEYTTKHTYPGPGKYIIRFYDPNRIGGILNMKSSVYTPFYIETELQINPSIGQNRSPILLAPPIDYAEINEVFEHNPAAYDLMVTALFLQSYLQREMLVKLFMVFMCQ